MIVVSGSRTINSVGIVQTITRPQRVNDELRNSYLYRVFWKKWPNYIYVYWSDVSTDSIEFILHFFNPLETLQIIVDVIRLRHCRWKRTKVNNDSRIFDVFLNGLRPSNASEIEEIWINILLVHIRLLFLTQRHWIYFNYMRVRFIFCLSINFLVQTMI